MFKLTLITILLHGLTVFREAVALPTHKHHSHRRHQHHRISDESRSADISIHDTRPDIFTISPSAADIVPARRATAYKTDSAAGFGRTQDEARFLPPGLPCTDCTVPPLSKIAPHTQKCTGQSQCVIKHSVVRYQIQIGEPYNGGSGCHDIIFNLMIAYSMGATRWHCDDDGHGDTFLQLTISSGRATNVDNTGGLNWVLMTRYPMVNGFNCPDY